MGMLGGLMPCLLAGMAGCGRSETASSSAESAEKGPALVAAEARLDLLTREVADLKAKHQAELKNNLRKLAEEEEKIRKENNEIRLEGADLERRIHSLEAENLRVSNETVTVIGNLKARLYATGRKRDVR